MGWKIHVQEISKFPVEGDRSTITIHIPGQVVYPLCMNFGPKGIPISVCVRLKYITERGKEKVVYSISSMINLL